MKKYLAIFTTIILGLCIFISFSAHAQIQNNMSTRDFKSGKWVPEYGGASKPFFCFVYFHVIWNNVHIIMNFKNI